MPCLPATPSQIATRWGQNGERIARRGDLPGLPPELQMSMKHCRCRRTSFEAHSRHNGAKEIGIK